MKLKGKIVIKEKIHDTKAKFYRDLVEGDVLHVSIRIGWVGKYATGIRVTCGRTGETRNDSMNNFVNRLDSFKVEQCDG